MNLKSNSNNLIFAIKLKNSEQGYNNFLYFCSNYTTDANINSARRSKIPDHHSASLPSVNRKSRQLP